jgi:hypothetical protein
MESFELRTVKMQCSRCGDTLNIHLQHGDKLPRWKFCRECKSNIGEESGNKRLLTCEDVKKTKRSGWRKAVPGDANFEPLNGWDRVYSQGDPEFNEIAESVKPLREITNIAYPPNHILRWAENNIGYIDGRKV